MGKELSITYPVREQVLLSLLSSSYIVYKGKQKLRDLQPQKVYMFTLHLYVDIHVFQKIFSQDVVPGGSVTSHQEKLAKSYKVGFNYVHCTKQVQAQEIYIARDGWIDG